MKYLGRNLGPFGTQRVRKSLKCKKKRPNELDIIQPAELEEREVNMVMH